jgi:hypothetical protein
MTQCNSQLSFGLLHGKQIVGAFDGGDISSDGGLMLVAEADEALGVTRELSGVLSDQRQVSKVRHSLGDLLRQRVYQIAQGYEDCNDADDLRHDAMFKTALGRLPASGHALASQPTLSRFENSVRPRQLLAMARVLLEVFFEQYATAAPERIILDFDATDDETHGQQQLGAQGVSCRDVASGSLPCQQQCTLCAEASGGRNSEPVARCADRVAGRRRLCDT